MLSPVWRLAALPAVVLALAIFVAGCSDDNENSQISAPPPIPGGVFSVTGDGFIDVYWTPIRGLDDIAGYGVYRSPASDGPYVKLASLMGDDVDQYRDETALNGQTYYYAVDAFDFEGNESALSLENVFDTPRPARAGLRIFSTDVDADRSGVDFSEQPSHADMLGNWEAASTDVYVFRDGDGVLRVYGPQHLGGEWNDVQDMGWTGSLDDVGYAPEDGWASQSPLGFELIEGHTYLVWTWDNHFVKIRVTNITSNYVDVDWAYQVDQGNPELARPPRIL